MMKTNRDLKALKSNYLMWLKFIEITDSVLKNSGYTKILTPYLVPSGAMESQLEPFRTQLNWGQKIIPLQLPTSPEFHLKKALSAGFGDLFEIKTCFRNEENSPLHRAEFLMLEFYKTNVDLPEFINLVLEIIDTISTEFHTQRIASSITQPMNQPIKHSDTLPNALNSNFDTQCVDSPSQFLKARDVQVIQISDLFKSLGLNLKPNSTLEDLQSFAKQLGIHYLADDTLDEIYYRIWIEMIEPNFDPKVLTVVHSYLPSQAALAQINHEGWADRFEIYWQGFELGNAFNELADSKTVEKRWISENEVRVHQGKQPHVIDYDFLSSLDQLPKSCGIAIGLERLFMALCDFKDIGEFRFFD